MLVLNSIQHFCREMVSIYHRTTVICDQTARTIAWNRYVRRVERNNCSSNRKQYTCTTVINSRKTSRNRTDHCHTDTRSNRHFAYSTHSIFIIEDPFDGPMVWTLHDAWGWCPAGGTLLHNQTQVCTRQNSVDCVSCYANWMPQIPKSGQLLMNVAQRLSPIVNPTVLHRMWQRLPDKIRSSQCPKRSPLLH